MGQPVTVPAYPPWDGHVHTVYCGHATGEMERYLETAVFRGLKRLVFTEHLPLPNGFDAEHRMDEGRLEVYVRRVQDLKEAWKNDLTILLGAEADWIPGSEPYTRGLLNGYPFDQVHMAVHHITVWPAGNWAFSYDIPGRTPDQLWQDYLKAVLEGIGTGLFDFLAHADLIKKPRMVPGEGALALRDKVLDVLAARGMVLEINTSGTRRPVAEPYPAESWVRAAVERGVPLLPGSDAHQPDHVAWRFPDVLAPVAAIPKATWAHFSARTKVFWDSGCPE